MNCKRLTIALTCLFIIPVLLVAQESSKKIMEQKKFVIVIPSYNNKQWYKANLDSVFNQKYDNYRIIYIDDCSSDGTYQLVENYIKEKGFGNKVTLIRNEMRCKALANIYNAVHSCADNEIIVLVDGDDQLAHSYALHRLNSAYANSTIWLVYSQFKRVPSKDMGWNKRFTKKFIDECPDRNYSPSHLRTFYAGLFKRIQLADLLYEGDFFQMTYDMAIMLPMMEMARSHVFYTPQILYIYNEGNPLSDHIVDRSLQLKLDIEIRMRKRYEPLETLFLDKGNDA